MVKESKMSEHLQACSLNHGYNCCDCYPERIAALKRDNEALRDGISFIIADSLGDFTHFSRINEYIRILINYITPCFYRAIYHTVVLAHSLLSLLVR